jgi:hypothetical protein
VYRFRGRRPTGEVTHVWDRLVVRDGVSYQLNRAHPLVSALFDALDDVGDQVLEQLLRAIEISLPTDVIYADMGSERRVHQLAEGEDVEPVLADIAVRLIATLGDDTKAIDRVLDSLAQIEPFSSHPSTARRVVEAIRHGRQ